VTGFHLWAIQNQGHLRANDPTEDILSTTVARGLDFLFAGALPSGVLAANADVARGAIAPGVSDMNANGRSIDICPFEVMYSRGVAGAAIAASVDGAQIIGVGPFAGDTYETFLEDAIDHYGTVQNTAGGIGPRGGWDYSGPSPFRSDMSINSWLYVAMEGAQTVFGIDVPDWIIQETEYALIFHQTNAAGSVPFGYSDANPLIGPPHGQATTGGGLSGLALNELAGPQVLPGAVIATAGLPLNTIAAKRAAALGYLGDVWPVDSSGGLGEGNRNNYYAMWTVTRALRLTAIALSLPAGDVVELTNGGVDFDWETGETLNPDLGNVPPSGDPREGYFHWLVVEQDTVSSPLLRGRWDSNTYLETFGYGISFETAMAILILTPRVFLSACPGYDAPTPADGSTISVSAEQPMSFDVVASDLNAGDIVTLTTGPLPPGATFISAPGNPAMGTFSWTPTIAQIGVHNVQFFASDGTALCPPTPLRVNIEVSECFALIATGMGTDPFTIGHTFQTQLSNIQSWYPVLMDSPATLTVTLPPPPQGGPAGAQAIRPWNETVVAEYFVEIVMWNPVVFPANPEQHTRGMQVRVFDNGHIDVRPFGTSDNMEFLQVQREWQPNGTLELTFPFVVNGL
jgi:hypothetical protein